MRSDGFGTEDASDEESVFSDVREAGKKQKRTEEATLDLKGCEFTTTLVTFDTPPKPTRAKKNQAVIEDVPLQSSFGFSDPTALSLTKTSDCTSFGFQPREEVKEPQVKPVITPLGKPDVKANKPTVVVDKPVKKDKQRQKTETTFDEPPKKLYYLKDPCDKCAKDQCNSCIMMQAYKKSMISINIGYLTELLCTSDLPEMIPKERLEDFFEASQVLIVLASNAKAHAKTKKEVTFATQFVTKVSSSEICYWKECFISSIPCFALIILIMLFRLHTLVDVIE